MTGSRRLTLRQEITQRIQNRGEGQARPAWRGRAFPLPVGVPVLLDADHLAKDGVANIPFWFNDAPTLAHFRYLFEQTLFLRWLLNSLIIGVRVVVITLVAAAPAGYSWRG